MRVLADSSVWIEHFRTPSPALVQLIARDELLVHALVIGELAIGSIPKRSQLLEDLQAMPRANIIDEPEFLHFVQRNDLIAKGVGFVDVHLLGCIANLANAWLWTLDRRLAREADRLGLAYFAD